LQAFREANDRRGIGDLEMQLGWAYMRMGAYDQVAGHLEAALALFREVGDATWQAFTLAGLGELAIRQNDYGRANQFLEESLAISEQHDNKWGMAICLGSLGWIALRQHDFQRVREYLGKSLSIRKEIGDQGGLAWCLEKLTEVKYHESDLKDAVKIFASAEAIRASLGSKIDPVDQPEYDRIVSELRAALGADEFAAAWTAGKTMPVTDVIELALSRNGAQGNIPAVDKVKYEGLTAREREVAAWIAQGKSNREIAETMTVSTKTIETYVTRILNKLGFDSRVQIATWALEKGLK
jgi:DNA-binding CsgD family transcriptional regulator